MSLHLQSVPRSLGSSDLDKIDAAVDITELGDKVNGVSFKVKTNVDNLAGMDVVFDNPNNFFGFKNKQKLMEFRNKGEMLFYTQGGQKVEILFTGNFPREDTINFVNAICAEYTKITGAPILKIDSSEKIEEKKKELPKFKISTIMTNYYVIESIMRSSFLGFASQEDLMKFKGNGKILLNKTTEGTYDIMFVGDFNRKEAKSYVQNLTDEYKEAIQEITYNKVMDKIKKEKYVVESEVVDNNNSIILTLNID